jgi:predicted O-linked N-acetylglucosamine transferase (SPINDLY family)/predicted SAM-dependent methyltransferase
MELQARIKEGEELRDGGRLDEALAWFEAIIGSHPELAAGHYKLGTVLARQEKAKEAEQAYRRALALRPIYPEACNNLGVLLNDDGYWAEAENLLRCALAERPDYFEAHLNVADVLQKFGRLPEALYHACRAMELRAESPTALERRASILNSMGRMKDAVELLQSRPELGKSHSPYWTMLAVALQGLGRHDEADTAHDRSIELAPGDFLPRMSRLYFSNYLQLTPVEQLRRHADFGAWVRAELGPPNADFSNLVPDRDRRLRVGFVSGDFRRHSVAYFVPGALDLLDRRDFQLFAYSVSFYTDEVTGDLRTLFNVWRDAAGLKHMELFELIRKDRIDILVDLSGHTNDNRLMVFARRPAPVQVSYLGYPNTTGVDTIDYRLTDAIADPPELDDGCHTEALYRMDRCFLCYTPPEHAPDLSPRPEGRSQVVFGSFNSRAKYRDDCLDAWARVLQQLPDARLVLKSQVGTGDESGRNDLVECFVARGIAAERIEVLARINDKSDHLAAYGDIDIALDTFPYNGTTTTCEALWMGVPVVTVRGGRHAGRVGASIMDAIGLPELVADSVEEFVDIAVALANDLPRLRELRTGMRQRLLSSSLCDRGDMGFALGDALREMWYRYCDTRRDAGADLAVTAMAAETEAIRLHIGGEEIQEGWKILNVEERDGVDFVGDVRDLNAFDDESCSEIYVSHVLEYLSQAEVLPVFNELHRLLRPGGKLFISVPDMDTLSRMFVNPAFGPSQKFSIMRMMFGDQTKAYDFHRMGYCFDFMIDYLKDVGFTDLEHVESFGIFKDTSTMAYQGHPISLNLIAVK